MLREATDVKPLNQLIEEMRDTGIRDLLGEGISPEGAECLVEVELSQANGPNLTVKCSQARFASAQDLRRNLGSDLPVGEVSLEVVRVRIKKAISKPAAREKMSELGPETPEAAYLGKRTVAYGSNSGEARLYKWESLQPGNKLQGCSLIESANSTYFVPEGWSLAIDHYGNAQARHTVGRQNPTRAKLQETNAYGKHQ
jgi:N-methylhydantoinase A/oxoprolinase/acetone carboxylase beta subunit